MELFVIGGLIAGALGILAGAFGTDSRESFEEDRNRPTTLRYV